MGPIDLLKLRWTENDESDRKENKKYREARDKLRHIQKETETQRHAEHAKEQEDKQEQNRQKKSSYLLRITAPVRVMSQGQCTISLGDDDHGSIHGNAEQGAGA